MFLKIQIDENTRRMSFEDSKSTAGIVGDSNVDGIIFNLPENSEYFEFRNAVVFVIFFDATNKSHRQLLDQVDDYYGMPKWTFDDNVLKNDATSRVSFFLHMVISDTSGKVLKSWNTLPSNVIVYKNRDYDNQEEEAARETDIDRLAGLVTTLTEKAKSIGDVEKVLSSITGSAPKPVDTRAKMVDDGHIYLYTGDETDLVTGALYYYIDGDLTYGGVYGSYDLDTTLTEGGKAADAGAVGAAIDEIKEDLSDVKINAKTSDSTTDSVIADSSAHPGWIKYAYIHNTSGEVVKSDTAVASVSGLIRIPNKSVAVISTLFNTVRYATYDRSGTVINVYADAFGINFTISSDDAYAFRIQVGAVDDSDLLRAVKIKFVYDDSLAHSSDVDRFTGFSNEFGSASGNPIHVSGAARWSLTDVDIADGTNGEVVSLCGKNLFHFQHKNSGMVKNGVTFHYYVTQTMAIDSSGATASTLSADSTFTGCTQLDGVTAYHNFHFRFKVDTPVFITPNYSYDPHYDDKISMYVCWVEDGSIKATPIGYEGASFLAKAGVQYGIRVRVAEGFSGSITLRPQVEIGSVRSAYEQYNGGDVALPITDGSANLFDLPQANRLVYNRTTEVAIEFGYATKSFTLKADNPSSAVVLWHPDYDGKINGKTAYYLCKFTPGAVPVAIWSIPDVLKGLVRLQILDGTNIINYSDTKPYLFTAEAEKEYGIRFVAEAGSSFECEIKPIIATGREALKLVGTDYPVANLYSDGNATLSMTYSKATYNNQVDRAIQVAKGIDTLTAGKIISPFARLREVGPVITFIDDDTTNPTLVQRFHDILAAESVVGNYAVELHNVESYQDTMPQMLLDYEQEGFGMLYHCYKQDGDADRYWESGNAMYDETLIRQNFYRGLRAYKQLGLNSARYWVTPYGVNDEFIRSLAKETDMECLLSCPTGNYACNAVLSLGSNFYRYNLPRWIFLSNSDNDYQGKALIDGCAATNGWLIIVTHVNSWPSAMIEQNAQRLTALIQYAKTAGCEIKNFIEAFQTFKPLLMLNELF